MLLNKCAAAALSLLILMTGCATIDSTVMLPIDPRVKFSGIVVMQGEHFVPVPEAIAKALFEEIESGLYAGAGFRRVEELRLSYSVVDLDQGSRLKRFTFGGFGDVGEGYIRVQILFSNAAGKQLGMTQVVGNIDNGVFGGGFSEVISKVAAEIATFTRDTYHPSASRSIKE